MKMSTKFTCRFCKEQFDQPKGLYKHLQVAHSAGSSKDNRTCPICGVLCSKYESYRDHLLHIHGQENEGQKLTFKSLNDFLLWKTELEMKYSCKYNLQSTPKVLPTKERKYFYQCDRSDSKQKDKKTLSVVLKTCASVISVFEGAGVLKVEYWDTHTNHNSLPSASTQNELEAAISSVEMVNAIGEGDDSFDKSQEFDSNSSNADKQSPSMKTNLSGINNSLSNSTVKTKNAQSSSKDIKKKTNTSILYSLASVACGKGISKKPSNKLNAEKNTDSISSNDMTCSLKDLNITLSENSVNADKPKTDLDPSVITSVITSQLTVSPVTTSPISSAGKILGRPPIAPKPPGSNSVNSLFTGNNTFSNQVVIVNPVGVDQNSTSSVFPGGQNILLSLPLGHSILPANNSSQPSTQNTSGDKLSSDKNKFSDKKFFIDKRTTKSDSPSNTKSKAAPPVSPKKSSSKLNSSNMSITTNPAISNSSPVTLTSISNAPVILSSLPVGSTFMSVNNNLIPIASPSGTFLPTSLPANIVLTPINPTPATSQNSKPVTLSSPSQITPSLRFTSPSSAAITISSMVKEPVYTSTTLKQLNNISSTSQTTISPVLPLGSKSLNVQNKYVPITIANASIPKPVSAAKATKSFSSSKVTTPRHEIVVTPVTPASSAPSAKKRASKSILKQKEMRKNLFEPSPLVVPNKSTAPVANTQVTNAQLNLAPITSVPNVSMNTSNKLGTLLFESDGEVYMLEPIETDVVQTTIPKLDKIQPLKVNKAMQTENSGLTELISRKKRPPPSADDSVLLKVKCYQMEMKYITCQTECKRLKVELTKEKIKNAELQGKQIENMEVDDNSDGCRAQEIIKEIEDKFGEVKDDHIYTMTKTSVLRSLYEDLEELCKKNNELYSELENYRAHDKFYKSLKKKLHDEDF